MIEKKINRAIYQMRYLNPEMYILMVNLWKMEIGEHKIFKFRCTLLYFIGYLEQYLSECEDRFQMLAQQAGFQGPGTSADNLNKLRIALDGFIVIDQDKRNLLEREQKKQEEENTNAKQVGNKG